MSKKNTNCRYMYLVLEIRLLFIRPIDNLTIIRLIFLKKWNQNFYVHSVNFRISNQHILPTRNHFKIRYVIHFLVLDPSLCPQVKEKVPSICPSLWSKCVPGDFAPSMSLYSMPFYLSLIVLCPIFCLSD